MNIDVMVMRLLANKRPHELRICYRVRDRQETPYSCILSKGNMRNVALGEGDSLHRAIADCLHQHEPGLGIVVEYSDTERMVERIIRAENWPALRINLLIDGPHVGSYSSRCYEKNRDKKGDNIAPSVRETIRGTMKARFEPDPQQRLPI